MELTKYEDDTNFIGENDKSVNYKREQWDNKWQGFLTQLGYIVAMGNLWRFPYLCMKNGGGAFLIPFVLSGIFLAYPIMLLEISLGQFTSKAVHKCWEACPLFQGIGYGMLITLCTLVYYVMIVTWTMYFIGSSFMSPLPWATCNNWWNTDDCFADVATSVNSSNMTLNSVPSQDIVAKLLSASTEEFFENKVLQLSSGIEDISGLNIPILLCLAGSWIIIFLCLMKGVKTIGKVVYVTATLPVLLIIILFIRSVIEPGAVDGILFYVTPDLNRLKDINVWIEAALQILYSSGVLCGPLITIQGFNKFKNNCVRDAALILCAGEGTSVLAGFLVFSVLGSMAHQRGVTIQEVTKSGPGLAFIVYPEAVSMLPLPNLWAVLFFIMIYTLALDSTFGSFEPIITAVTDSFKVARQHRTKTTLVVVIVMFVLSIPFTLKISGYTYVILFFMILSFGSSKIKIGLRFFDSGFYLFQLIDWYLVSISYPVIAILECLIFGWIYGADRFCKDIELMSDRTVPMFIRFCWCIITPIVMALLLVSVIVLYEPPSYGNYEYPVAATTCGLLIAALPIIPLPVVAMYQIRKADGNTFIQKIKNAAKPSCKWKPGRLYQRPTENDEDINDRNLSDTIKLNLFGRRHLTF